LGLGLALLLLILLGIRGRIALSIGLGVVDIVLDYQCIFTSGCRVIGVTSGPKLYLFIYSSLQRNQPFSPSKYLAFWGNRKYLKERVYMV